MQIRPRWKIFNHPRYSPKWSFTGNFKGASLVLIADAKINVRILKPSIEKS